MRSLHRTQINLNTCRKNKITGRNRDQTERAKTMMNSRTLWNDNWYFAKTALGVNWEDRQIWEAKMQPVDLPHDWLIYDTKNLYEDSIGWYRKNFAYAPDKTGNDDRVILRFEGVYMDSSIYVNGEHLGDWKYGYSTFDWDITDALHEGENEIVLRVVFQAPNSRWYSGAGIYRNVWMIRLPETHIPLDGIYTSSVETNKGYDLTIDTELEWGTDSGNYELEYCLRDTDNSKSPIETETSELFRVKQPLTCGQNKISMTIPVDNPRKWDITDPYLYDLQDACGESRRLTAGNYVSRNISVSAFAPYNLILTGVFY